jgi:hypothetical protein
MARPDPTPLFLKLEDQGLSATQITSALTNMGFSKSEARDAITAAGLDSSNPDRAGASASTPAGGNGKTQPEPPAGPPSSPEPDEPGERGGIPSFGLRRSGVSPSLRLPTSMPSAGDLASLLCGLLAYTLFLNYLRYGPKGVSGWLRAKFMNDPLDVTARLEAEGSKLQAPQIGGSDALGQLLEEPLTTPSADTSAGTGIDTGPVAPAATNTLNA